MNEPLLRVLSLGAGVQSSTLYLMAVKGAWGDRGPTLAVFADTQWESRRVYDWLAELERIGGDVIPIISVTAGNIRDDLVSGIERGHRIANIPFHAVLDGKKSMLRRTCTKEYKLEPIRKTVRREYDRIRAERGITGKLAVGSVEQWIGISTDEATRMRDSDVAYITNRYPLIEQDMSRADCLIWMAEHRYPAPPKSSCIGCPYHDDALWADMRENDPEAWADAVDFDRWLRSSGGITTDGKGVLRGLRKGGAAFLHGSLRPLDEAPLTHGEKADDKDSRRGLLNLFENECEGMCGV